MNEETTPVKRKMRTGIEQHQQWCVHYQRRGGMPHREACAKGIVYDDLAKVSELGDWGSMLRLPCIRDHHIESERKGQPLCECPHLQWPTLAESEAHEKEMAAHMEKMMVALIAIDPIRKKRKGHDWNGTIECPNCKGKLHVRHSGYNGHVWAKCETDDCVSWIE